MKLVVVGKRVGKCFSRPLCLFVFTALTWLCSALITSIAVGEDNPGGGVVLLSRENARVLNSAEYLGGDSKKGRMDLSQSKPLVPLGNRWLIQPRPLLKWVPAKKSQVYPSSLLGCLKRSLSK